MWNCDSSAGSVPVTHALYAAHCSAVGVERQQLPVFVQVQRKGETLCARVLECVRFSDAREAEWFKVEIVGVGKGWFPPSRVRLCSGLDSLCVCESCGGTDEEVPF